MLNIVKSSSFNTATTTIFNNFYKAATSSPSFVTRPLKCQLPYRSSSIIQNNNNNNKITMSSLSLNKINLNCTDNNENNQQQQLLQNDNINNTIGNSCNISNNTNNNNNNNNLTNYMNINNINNIINMNNGRMYYSNMNMSMKPILIGQPTPKTHPHLLKNGEVIKGITKDEFKQRRMTLMSSLPNGSIVLLFTPPEQMMSYDIPWAFRQNTNFYYYTGFNEPEAILALEKIDTNTIVESMWVREKIKEKEIWDGPRCGELNVKEIFGIDNGYKISDLRSLNSKLSKYDSILIGNKVSWEEIFNKLEIGSKKIYSLENIIQNQRLIKSNQEIKMMDESGTIAGQSFHDTMQYIKVGMNEYEVSAYFEYAIKKRGAQRMSYPPVVASGSNANIIHYIANNQITKDNELLLMDAGAEYWGFTSDITRTFPVNGKFTKHQRLVYEAVLDVNKQCIERVREGESIQSIHNFSIYLIAKHLYNLGIVKVPSSFNSNNNNNNTNNNNQNQIEYIISNRLYTKYYPHSIGHYLGMDTHDTIDISYDIPLQTNMIITIEPGIYIAEDDDSVDPEWRGIAIRVEDDVVVASKDNSNSPLVLTRSAPKEVDHIESIMMNQSK